MNVNLIIVASLATIGGFILGYRFKAMVSKQSLESCLQNVPVKKRCNVLFSGWYEHHNYHDDPFERGKHLVEIQDMKEDYVLYRYKHGSITGSVRKSYFEENYVKVL